MGDTSQNSIPPDSNTQRAMNNLTRRVVWTTDTTECYHCDSAVNLHSGHYYVTLRERTDDDTKHREVVFCSRPCAEEYFCSASHETTLS